MVPQRGCLIHQTSVCMDVVQWGVSRSTSVRCCVSDREMAHLQRWSQSVGDKLFPTITSMEVSSMKRAAKPGKACARRASTTRRKNKWPSRER